MIYLDSSVALAFVFAEDRVPERAFWSNELVSSELLKYEVWNRTHARRGPRVQQQTARELLEGIEFIELVPTNLSRALEPFPVSVRTLDALHLATAHWLREAGLEVVIASYDRRFSEAAAALGFPAFAL
ncbi:MAG: type II toxin-antitoxin system VapC family toxin [Hyphomicrobiaceae bacterium]|nr:MAG: type II toxin-antitoxin system VapC family toxin [Hyphomicrobiaceae bacterium]